MEIGFLLFKGKGFADNVSKIFTENEYSAIGIYYNHMNQGIKVLLQYPFNRLCEHPGIDLDTYTNDCLTESIYLREIRSAECKDLVRLILVRYSDLNIFSIMSEIFSIDPDDNDIFNLSVKTIINDVKYLKSYQILDVSNHSRLDVQEAIEKSKVSQYHVLADCSDRVLNRDDVLSAGNMVAKYWYDFTMTLFTDGILSFKNFYEKLKDMVSFMKKITDKAYQFNITYRRVWELPKSEAYSPPEYMLGKNRWENIFERLKLFIEYLESPRMSCNMFFGMINDITSNISKFSSKSLVLFEEDVEKIYHIKSYIPHTDRCRDTFQDLITDINEISNLSMQKGKTPKIYMDNLINKVNRHAAELGVSGLDIPCEDISSSAIIVSKSRRGRDFEVLDRDLTIVLDSGLILSTNNPDISVMTLNERKETLELLEVLEDPRFANIQSKLIG